MTLGVTVPFGAIAAFYLWFVGVVEFTGCFIGCGPPNRFGGTLLLLGAGSVATGTVVAGWVALVGSTRRLRTVALVAGGAAAVVMLASIMGF